MRMVKSHPTWVRGLKLVVRLLNLGEQLSHPTWVRGLKLYFPTKFYLDTSVAPYVGAWIETKAPLTKQSNISCRTLRGCVD